jgi:tetratricopeptide (TPR) repeat protein
LSERALAIVEKAVGPDSPELLLVLVQLGRHTQEYDRRPQIFERALSLAEKYRGDYDTLAVVIKELARSYALRRREHSVSLYEELVEMADQARGVGSHEFSYAFHDLADAYAILDENQDADLRRKQVLDRYEHRLPADHIALARHFAGLAKFYFQWGRDDEAESPATRALAMVERVAGSAHQNLSDSDKYWFVEFLEAWANAKSNRRLHGEAIALWEKVVHLSKDDLEASHPDPDNRSIGAIGRLARDYSLMGDWVQATAHWRRSTFELMRTYRNPTTNRWLGRNPKTYSILNSERMARSAHARWGAHFVGLIGALSHTASAGDPEVLRETFHLAQWALDLNSGLPVAQMAARSSNPRLAALQRERDDLVKRFNDRDGINYADQRPIDVRISELNSQIEMEFPGTAASVAPEPLTVSEVQSALRENEAVVLIVDGTPSGDDAWLDDVFVWVITKTDARWVKAGIDVHDLARHARSLRCGLDASAWDEDRRARASDCGSLSSSQPSRDGNDNIIWETLPYDLSRAYAIYEALLLPMEDLLAGKHLLVVPSTALNQLPLHVLLTRLPANTTEDMQSRTVARLDTTLRAVPLGWELRTGDGVVIERPAPGGPADKAGLRPGDVLVAVGDTQVRSVGGTIATIRAHAPGSQVSLRVIRNGQELTLTAELGEFIIRERSPRFFQADDDSDIQWLARNNAITVLPSISALSSLRAAARASAAGHPILGVGNPLFEGSSAERSLALLARSKQSCPELVRVVRTASTRRPVRIGANRATYGIANTADIRAQSPLPETADEVCAVASNLKAAPDDILLGQHASETVIKGLSRAGRLADYRVVHFATHGTLGGEFEGLDQAGLLLTPPDKGSEEDDGYLSAREIAQLKLDAEWVVLSACNTAGRSLSHAQLPRAFFYAGARALLASHWPVASEATVKLVTTTIQKCERCARDGACGGPASRDGRDDGPRRIVRSPSRLLGSVCRDR